MASSSFPHKRLSLEIIFWDLTIVFICGIRRIVRALLASLPSRNRLPVMIFTWIVVIVTGISAGWFLGFLYP
jgi:hypothetical protein